EYKGEFTVFEVADGYSVGHITGGSAASRVVAGDRLTFSRRLSAAEVLRGEARPAPDGFLGTLPSKEQFLARLDEFAGRPVTVALARLDSFEKNVAALGREEAERILTFVFEKLSVAFPQAVQCLWQSDALALAWPGDDQAAAKPVAYRLAAELKEPGPVSLGLVFSPGGEAPESLVDDARKALNEAAFAGPGQVAVFGPLSLNVSGDRLFEGGDLSGALKEYERGLAMSPSHLNLLNSLGVCHGRLGHASQALEVFTKIAELDSDNMMAHYNLGYTHLLSGRMREAEASMGRAAELAPDNFEPLFHFGKIALELGHLDRALPALKRAGELGESRPVVFRLLGEALMLAHDHQGALAAFKKAVKTAPNDAYALSALGALFVELSNDREVARSLFQKSVEIDPTNCLYRQRLGRLLFTLGDYDGAEHHLTMAVEYGSRAPEVHYQLGRVAEETGRPEQARSHYQAALDQDPAYKPALERVDGAE
ncbi:MAG: tetratricopeptide repeat protein, partial [Candidatus Adiutrix sp.]|nr:tetratricopeptide repeat protein [Candidatus Adiutrix sp.]